ncbi:MAG: nucleotidyltransferase family protein [Thermoanaerobaculia bacterium]
MPARILRALPPGRNPRYSGPIRFDPERLFADARYAAYAAAGVAAVETGGAGPIVEALKEDSSNGKEEIAAFAVSTQGLSALVAGGGGIEALPAPLSVFLFEEISLSGARAQRLQTTLGETVLTLRAAGVEVVALKGAVLAFFHYPDPALRPMGDLDLLLREPGDLSRATEALESAGWLALFDTPRHRVFARRDERVARPASEDPDNPIRVEIHTSFRLPVLGCVYDASAALRAEAETRDLAGTPVHVAAGSALVLHLLFHAAEDFAGNGIRGIQAHDFHLLASKTDAGALVPEISEKSKISMKEKGEAPLLYAADAIQRLFPLTFREAFLSSLSSHVDPALRSRAAALPALRYTRPARGWTRTLLSLVDGRVPRARFLLRTLFPTLGEVKANAAPDASGLVLTWAWLRVLGRRLQAASRPR